MRETARTGLEERKEELGEGGMQGRECPGVKVTLRSVRPEAGVRRRVPSLDLVRLGLLRDGRWVTREIEGGGSVGVEEWSLWFEMCLFLENEDKFEWRLLFLQ